MLCPKEASDTPLEDYFNNLQKGAIFSKNNYGVSAILDFALSKNKQSIFVVCHLGKDAIKPYALTEIKYENGFFIHINRGSFFEEKGAYKYWTLAQGLKWSGGDTFDDYC